MLSLPACVILALQVRDICSSIDEAGAGANCAVALHAAAKQRMSGVGPRLRFQVSCNAKGLSGR